MLKSVTIALVFNVLDMITGFAAAVKEKDIQSCRLRDGMFKKVGFGFCYFLAWLIDSYGDHVGLALGVKILPIMVGYVVLTETVSILENIHHLNPDLLPDKLFSIFHIKGGET